MLGGVFGFGALVQRIRALMQPVPLGTLAANGVTGEKVIYVGTGTTVLGQLYYMTSGGAWADTDADAAATADRVYLAMALGTAPGIHGMMVGGFINATAAIDGAFTKGAACYLSGTAGKITFTAPSGTGDVVRIIGWGTSTANVIDFRPEATSVVIP